MYRRPEGSKMAHRQRLSELATGTRFPERAELELVAHACNVDAAKIVRLYELAQANADGGAEGSAALGREISRFKKAYKAAAIAAFSRVRLPYPGSPRLVDFRNLYVEPTVSVRNLSPSHVREIESSVSRTRRIVLLGDPGGGKTTLAAHLVLLSQTYKNGARLPFLIPFRDARRYFLGDELSLVELLNSWCRSRFEIREAESAIERLLASGGITLVFDGLDELVDMSDRSAAAERINMIARRYPTTSIVVTSRTIGYDEAPVDSEQFEEFVLGPLAESSVQEFSLNWFKLIAEPTGRDAKESSAAFLWEVRLSAPDLQTNPLMLGLLCSLYSYDGYLPRNRPEVYEKCSSLLFDSWDRQRNIVTALPLNAHVKGAIGALALWMVESGAAAGVARSQVIVFIRDYLLEKRYEDADEAEDAATQLVDYCTGRAWVLTNIGSTGSDELYGFTHRTFLEYFCARQIVRMHGSPQSLFEALLTRILALSGEVISQICLQILASSVEDGADNWLRLACDWADECGNAIERSRLVGFLARALGFIVPRPELARRIVSMAYSELRLDSNPRDIVKSLRQSPIVECMMATAENMKVVSNQLLREVANSDAMYENEPELLFATYPCAPAAGNPRFDHNGYMGRAWGSFAAALRAVSIDRVSQREWHWTREYDFAQGVISVSEYLQRGGSLANLLEGNRPRGLVLPSFVVGLLGLIGGGEPVYYRNDLNPSVFLAPSTCADLLNLLLETPAPWLTYTAKGGTGTRYTPGSFALRQSVEDENVMGLYVLLLASQCDEQEIVSAGSDQVVDKFEFWSEVARCSIVGDFESRSNIAPGVLRLLSAWRSRNINFVDELMPLSP